MVTNLTGASLGSYQLQEPIGQGGMAIVYKAYHPATDRHVAVKVLSPTMTADPQFRARFDREAKAIANLDHVHILPVHDYGEHDGILYLVMRYVPTGTLKDRLARGPLHLDETLCYLDEIGDAVDYAHERQVLHRDLKPANVLLDDRNHALLSDFGLSRLIDSDLDLTEAGSIMGTPAYMSPEQAQGLPVNEHSDLYALGVILYEMLTSKCPFMSDNPLSVLHKHIHETPPSPRALRPALPETVAQVVAIALAKTPADRFSSARAMVDALRQAISGSATLAEDHTPILGRPADEDLIVTVVDAEKPVISADEPVDRDLAVVQPSASAVEAERVSLVEDPSRHWLRRISVLVGVFATLIIAIALVRGTFLGTEGDDVSLDEQLLAALDAGDTTQAIALAERYIDREPPDPVLSEAIATRARESAAAGRSEGAQRAARVLAIIDRDCAATLADEMNDAGVAALLEKPPQESVARTYFETGVLIDELLERDVTVRSVALYNLAQLLEADDPTAAAALYREAIYIDSNMLDSYYALSSLLLVKLADTPNALDEAVEVAQSGRQHLDDHYCQGAQASDELYQSWLCFLLLTTEAGARIAREDNLVLSLPTAERAVRLAEANAQFGAGRYTAEAYYYVALLTEPDTDLATLCAIIQHHNRDLDRHRNWAIYANEQLNGRSCLPD